MAERRSFISAMLSELSRRKVLRTVGAYAVGVFVLLQLLDGIVEPLRLPDWLPTLIVITLILGFPVVFMLAWLLDVTPQGVRRTPSAGQLSRGQTGALFTAMLLLTVVLGYGFYTYYSDAFDAPVAAVAGAPGPAPPAAMAAPENSIAVLPFADLSQEGDKTYLGDGIAEEILNLLAQVDGLQVAARTSSFAFRDQQRDVRDIGRLLNVRTVLEGSVRSDGDRLRLTAQLIRVDDGFHIWSKTYDREMTDVFAIQDEVASSIADALVESFDGLADRRTGDTDSLLAYEKYREGRLHWWRRTPQELQSAISLFAEALQADPNFAPACAALADSYLLLASYGNLSPEEAIGKAQAQISRALELDHTSAEAHAALGLARWQAGQMDSAESSLRHAISLNDAYIPAHLWLAGLLGDQGRWPEQSLVLERAMTLDPYNELLAINYAGNLAQRGKSREALKVLEPLLAVRPDSITLLTSAAPLARRAGELETAWRYADRAYDLAPESPVAAQTMAGEWLALDDLDATERVLRQGLERSGDNIGLAIGLFQVMLLTGRFEEAQGLLQQRFMNHLEAMPEALQRVALLQAGFLHMAMEDWAQASAVLDRALALSESGPPSEERVLLLTMAAAAHQSAGHAERADALLSEAERALRRDRVNGTDDEFVYYTEGLVMAQRGQVEPAMARLQTAYERGFRDLWLVRVDWRLDPLRDSDAFSQWQQRISDDLRTAREVVRAHELAEA